ncbi:MAG TPA: hypothetical protein VFP43_16885 [Mesorhizobium sp.]|nr:hypothetical protein [Mesorhizobium sp.]
MRRIAKQYDLPLKKIVPATMPEQGLADYLGRCHGDGTIELVMRATVDGQFVDHPCSPTEVWRTAAHELAHLKHMNHGNAFHDFFAELMKAIDNQQEDHKAKMIAKLVKMQASREGEAALGNTAAAEAFAAAINRMLIEYELHPSELDYARATDQDPVIEVRVDLTKYNIDHKRRRIAWQEALARTVAKAHLCDFLVCRGSNQIWFVGTKSHATVAEYVFGTLVPIASRLSYLGMRKYSDDLKRKTGSWAGIDGFQQAWLDAFITRINERFDEARQAAVVEADAVLDLPAGSESQALIRLSGALVKVNRYIDDKFKARKKKIHALDSGRSYNAEGKRRGREAADAIPIGRRGVTGGSERKRLTS